MSKFLPMAMAKKYMKLSVFISKIWSWAQIELIFGISECAHRALLSGVDAIQNVKVLANGHDQKVHDIVSFSSLKFEAELELSLFFAFQNELIELYHLAALWSKMSKFLPMVMAKRAKLFQFLSGQSFFKKQEKIQGWNEPWHICTEHF
jgi:hypothetical protein